MADLVERYLQVYLWPDVSLSSFRRAVSLIILKCNECKYVPRDTLEMDEYLFDSVMHFLCDHQICDMICLHGRLCVFLWEK